MEVQSGQIPDDDMERGENGGVSQEKSEDGLHKPGDNEMEIAKLNFAAAKPKPRLIKKAVPAPGSLVPKAKLNNGQEIPMLGLGTWKAKAGEVGEAVKNAIRIGYRMLDCAYNYLNEAEVGQGIKAMIDEGVVKREELFIVSKLWNTCHRPDLVEPALRNTLKDLQVDYLDMYLIHFPTAFLEEGDRYPRDNNGQVLFSDVDFVDTWKAMENLVQKGLVKSIGVSNFNSQQLQRLLDNATIPPVMNQIEIHPYLSQKKLVEFCKSKNIAVTAYSPLRSPDRQWEHEPSLLCDPKLVEISYKYNKSVAQVIIRWLFQRGIIVIPKSVNKNRLQENLNIFDFYLSDEDMDVIFSLNRNRRANTFESAITHREYPFNIEF